jgi:threonyl-tRNA synthetase
VARVNGELRDLAYEIKDGDVVEAVTTGSDEGRAVVRHSTAHVLAQAVQSMFPEAKLGIGPPIRDGFYASTTTSTSTGRSIRRTCSSSRSGCRRSRSRGSGSPVGW